MPEVVAEVVSIEGHVVQDDVQRGGCETSQWRGAVTFPLAGERRPGTLISTDGKHCIVRDTFGLKWVVDAVTVTRTR